MDDKTIVNIAVDQIDPHPQNPRGDLGDLTELADSIKAHGVMQNLTVLENNGRYTALIGHRRLAAAKLAGLKEVPCTVVNDLSMNEQVSIMLLENMQRTDLTIYEQAQGFQMMLDLGDKVETIAEKTGFSQTTVRHRLNIAKLDGKVLKKKEEDDSFQMSIKDLIALEQVSDLKKRNEILKDAHDSRSLASMANRVANDEKMAANEKKIMDALKKLGIKKAAKEVQKDQYSNKWDTVQKISLEKDPPKKIAVSGLKDGKVDGHEVFYVRYSYSRDVSIIRKHVREQRELSPWEIERKEIDKRRKQVKAAVKNQTAMRRDFILGIVNGKIDGLKDDSVAVTLLWKLLVDIGVYSSISQASIKQFLIGKPVYGLSDEEKAETDRLFEKTYMATQMMCIACSFLGDKELTDYNCSFKEDTAEFFRRLDGILGKWGFKLNDEEDLRILDGTSELYTKSEEKEDEPDEDEE